MPIIDRALSPVHGQFREQNVRCLHINVFIAGPLTETSLFPGGPSDAGIGGAGDTEQSELGAGFE